MSNFPNNRFENYKWNTFLLYKSYIEHIHTSLSNNNYKNKCESNFEIKKYATKWISHNEVNSLKQDNTDNLIHFGFDCIRVEQRILSLKAAGICTQPTELKFASMDRFWALKNSLTDSPKLYWLTLWLQSSILLRRLFDKTVSAAV